MVFTPKDWRDDPDDSTPINAAALEDLEKRVTDYANSIASSTTGQQRDFAYFLPSDADTAGTQMLSNTCNAAAIDSQGRFILVGEIAFGGVLQATVCRLLPSGELDTSFGTGGWFHTLAVASSSRDVLQGLAIDASDRIVTSGFTTAPGLTAFVMRLTTSGTLDTSFNAAGAKPGINVITPTGSTASAIYGVCVDASGKMVGSGIMTTGTGPGTSPVFMVRLTASGTVDTTFGTSGYFIDLVTGGGGTLWNCLAETSTGKYLAGGACQVRFTTTLTGGPYSAGATSITVASAGTLPAGIEVGNGLVLNFPVPGSAQTTTETVTVSAISGTTITVSALAFAHSAGTTVEVGSTSGSGTSATWSGSGNSVAVCVRLTSAGTYDTTFNTSGWNQAWSTGNFATDGQTISIQSDNKYLVAGYIFTGAFAQHTMVARFTNVGALDGTYGTSGISIPQSTTTGQANVLVLDSSDRAYANGSAVLRLTTSGAVDTAYGNNGTGTADSMGGTVSGLNGLAVLPDASVTIVSGRGTLASAPGFMQWYFALLNSSGLPLYNTNVLEQAHYVGGANALGTTFTVKFANKGAGHQPLLFYKDLAGIIHLEGVIAAASATGANETVFTLPGGYRPAGGVLHVPCAVPGTTTIVLATIWTTGIVSIDTGLASGVTAGIACVFRPV